jgi:hypothetical protein
VSKQVTPASSPAWTRTRAAPSAPFPIQSLGPAEQGTLFQSTLPCHGAWRVHHGRGVIASDDATIIWAGQVRDDDPLGLYRWSRADSDAVRLFSEEPALTIRSLDISSDDWLAASGMVANAPRSLVGRLGTADAAAVDESWAGVSSGRGGRFLVAVDPPAHGLGWRLPGANDFRTTPLRVGTTKGESWNTDWEGEHIVKDAPESVLDLNADRGTALTKLLAARQSVVRARLRVRADPSFFFWSLDGSPPAPVRISDALEMRLGLPGRMIFLATKSTRIGAYDFERSAELWSRWGYPDRQHWRFDALTVDPSRRWAATTHTGNPLGWGGPDPSRLQLWRLEDGQMVGEILSAPPNSNLWVCAFSHSSRLLLTQLRIPADAGAYAALFALPES